MLIAQITRIAQITLGARDNPGTVEIRKAKRADLLSDMGEWAKGVV